MESDEEDRTIVRPPGLRTGQNLPSPAPAAPAPAAPVRTQVATAPATFMPTTASPSASSSGHSMTLEPGTRLGEFEVTKTIGEGGFGIVYLAWDHSLDRKVALKEYMPSSIAFRAGHTEIRARSERHQETFEAGLKSFINEAKLLAQFDHPSLLKVYRFWEANGTAYMVMPFLEGQTLRDAVRAMPEAPDEAWIRSLLSPLFDALGMLHSAQCYHRDIAPDNILLLAETGRPLLLDFGAARRVIGDMTQALTAILKPGYAPVEQYAEIPNLKQGPWTDVYALAAVIHWMVTGKTPSPSVGRMFDDSHVPLAERAAGRYSPEFLNAVDRALAVMPDRRTPSIEAFREDLNTAPGFGTTLMPGMGSPAFTMPPATVPRTRPAMPPATGPASTTRGPTLPPARTVQPMAATQAPEPALPTAASPASASRAGLWIGLVVAALAIAGGAAYVMSSRQAPPVAAAPDATAARPGVQPAVAGPAVQPAASTAAVAPAVVAPPAEPPAEKPAAVVPAAVTPTAPAVVQDTTPSRPLRPAEARPGAEAEPRPAAAHKPAAVKPERRNEPAAADPPRAATNNDAECARLFTRISLGEGNAEVMERVRTLRCR